MAAVDIPEGLEELFQQSLFDHVLHYALLVGAIFQLVCIAAIVVLPSTEDDDDSSPTDQPRHSGGEATDKGAGEDHAQVVKGTPGGLSKKTAAKKARKRK